MTLDQSLTLFADDLRPGRVRHSDPMTSVRAARRARPSLEAEILDVLRQLRHATDDQIAGALPHRLASSVKTARSRLLADRKVCWTGSNGVSNAGSPMAIWKINPQGVPS